MTKLSKLKVMNNFTSYETEGCPINNLIIISFSAFSRSPNIFQCQDPSWAREFFHPPMTSTTILVRKREYSENDKQIERERIKFQINLI